ncbi:hypothetical protein, partial [Citrobacter freundii]
AQTIYSITLIAALNIPARYLSASLKKQATASLWNQRVYILHISQHSEKERKNFRKTSKNNSLI